MPVLSDLSLAQLSADAVTTRAEGLTRLTLHRQRELVLSPAGRQQELLPAAQVLLLGS